LARRKSNRRPRKHTGTARDSGGTRAGSGSREAPRGKSRPAVTRVRGPQGADGPEGGPPSSSTGAPRRLTRRERAALQSARARAQGPSRKAARAERETEENVLQGHLAWPVPALLALAFLWRVFYLLEFEKTVLFEGLVLDEANYHAWARAIASGDILGHGPFTSNPLAPYAIGLVYALLGPDLWTLRIVQAAVDTLTCYLIFRTTLHLFGRRPAMVALVLAAIYGPMIFSAGNLVATVWVLALVSGTLMLLTHPHRGTRHMVVAGVLFGLAVLGRPNLVLMLPFLPAAAHLGRKSFAWQPVLRSTAMWLLGAAVVLTPVAVRNGVEGGAWSPLPEHGGVNFWIGNNPDADGFFKTPRGSGLAGGQKSLVKSSISVAEKAVGHSLTASEASAWWRRRAMEFMVDQPGKAAELAFRKLVYSLNAYEKPLETNYYFAKSYSWLLRWATVGFGLVGGLGLAGFVLRRKQWRRQAVLLLYGGAYLASLVMTFVSMRYRLPLVLAFFPMAGCTVADLWDRVAERDWKRAAVPSVAATVGLAITNVPLPTINIDHDLAHTHFMLGNLAQDRKDWKEALKQHRTAVELYPEWGGYYNNLGLAYLRVGQPEEAVETLKKAVELGYGSRRVYRNLGKAYRALGRLDEAVEAFQKALEHSPRHFRTHLAIADLLARQGRYDEARAMYEKALTLAHKEKSRRLVQERLSRLERMEHFEASSQRSDGTGAGGRNQEP